MALDPAAPLVKLADQHAAAQHRAVMLGGRLAQAGRPALEADDVGERVNPAGELMNQGFERPGASENGVEVLPSFTSEGIRFVTEIISPGAECVHLVTESAPPGLRLTRSA